MTATSWTPPAELDEYRLVRPIGQGAMGQVFLAHDTVLDRPVAIKIIASVTFDPQSCERFLHEARTAARLQHPNVVTIHRVGQIENRPYIVSELVRGESLDRIPKPLPWQRALEIGIGLARGLAAAHQGGVLHRDIKPANAILADTKEVKLLDFGLAKVMDFQPMTAPASEEPAATAIGPVLPPPSGELDETSPMTPGPMASSSGNQIVGTPLYMAPEIWRSEPATFRSDVFSIGAVLYELCIGTAPGKELLTEGDVYAMSRYQPRSLAEAAPQVDTRFAAIVDRCLRHDPQERFPSGQALLEALEQLVASQRGVTIPSGNPYRGLRPFEATHRALFFGREREIHAVVELLRARPFVVVSGASGVGKSSLCRAGVLPLLHEGALGGERAWTSLSLFPGKRPLRALAAALAPWTDRDEEELERAFERPTQVARALRKRQGSRQGLILFLDQLEELDTLTARDEAEAVGRVLATLAEDVPGLRILATLRADFMAPVGELPHVAALLSRGLFLLPGLSAEGIRSAVVAPARLKGVSFESDALVDRILSPIIARNAERGTAEASLPLLQFALAELWEARDVAAHAITAQGLEAIGGVTGALSRHADDVLQALLPTQRAAARRILLRLVTADNTRVRRSQTELCAGDPATDEALDALVRGRLLVAREAEGATIYEVTHEALLSGWPTLREWLNQEADGRLVRQRLEAAAKEWERLDRSREALWGAAQLAELAPLDANQLTACERGFIEASRRSLEQRRLARRALVFAFGLAIIGAYVGIQLKWSHERDARIAQQLKLAQTTLSDVRRGNEQVARRRKEAFEAFARKEAAAGERLWAQAQEEAGRVQQMYQRVGQALEAALVLDGHRPDLRALFAQVLLERALIAERDFLKRERDELGDRLALYDDRGDLLRALHQPGTLSVTTDPGGVPVRLERYATDAKHKRVPALVADLGTTPVAPRSLEPGSYRLRILAPGNLEVFYPFVLGRGEPLTLDIPLPPAGRIPSGFVYVPPGRFLFGSSDEALRKSFLGAAPLQERYTPAYLIARHETTFAEWLEFLRALPPLEQGAHLPRAGSLGITGLLELGRIDESWRLTFRLTTRTYVATDTQRIDYEARTRRRSQDWLRFPVVGITAADARAYAAWLDRSGRLNGARLCSELEWERAARGADDREFPTGDALDKDDANYDETYDREPLGLGPDEAGSHSASASPFGVQDLAGNAWEWAESALSPASEPLARGGSYYQPAPAARSTNRQVVEPNFRDATVGTRICASYTAKSAR